MPENEVKKPEQSEKGDLDGEILNQIMLTGENGSGLFTPDQAPSLPEDQQPHAKIKEENKPKFGRVTEKHGEYKRQFLKDMNANPERYMVETPKGRMTITEAMKQGYDPVTKDFTRESADAIKERMFSGLDPKDREAIDKITTKEDSAGVPGKPTLPPQEEEEGLPMGAPGVPSGGPDGSEQKALPPELMAMLGGGK